MMYKVNSLNCIMFLSMCLLLFFNCNSQNKKSDTTYKINKIPDVEKFKILTTDELSFDLRKQQYNIEKLKMLSKGASDVEKQIIKKNFKINSRSYRNNRSRYFINAQINGIKENLHKSTDILTSECFCKLNNNTINVNMWKGIYNSFSFDINIDSVKSTSSFGLSSYEKFIYKKSETDSVFTESLDVNIKEQMLILKQKPRFIVGEEIQGHLTFKTDDYYERKENDSSDTVNVFGTIYFKCIVRSSFLD